jgi:hypothetical protein
MVKIALKSSPSLIDTLADALLYYFLDRRIRDTDLLTGMLLTGMFTHLTHVIVRHSINT